jgi:hypothetical protein
MLGGSPGTFDEERKRLLAARAGVPWRKWGPYLSERQWGTVREDYSPDGTAWAYFSHDQARSRATRWGEDGLAGFSDDTQLLCFALALWNERDPILKERLFGLTNAEGNHGEDVKEYYYYLDATPTYSYAKWLYKYPQRVYPYEELVAVNRIRTRGDLEYELIDTGVFDEGRYFDVQVEYAKAAPEDILVQISVTNRGPDPARLHLLPTIWFRNTWTVDSGKPKPILRHAGESDGIAVISAAHPDLGGERWLYVDRPAPILFTENETHGPRIAGQRNATRYAKDSINDYIVRGHLDAVNPDCSGTKAAVHFAALVEPGALCSWRLRLSDVSPQTLRRPFEPFDALMVQRRDEADAFYALVIPPSMDADRARVMRQALGGMLWSKQFYYYDAERWLAEHGVSQSSDRARDVRNSAWSHLINADVISMPDKWEYPFYSAWDLAFHAVALAPVDLDYAKAQLELLLHESYLHPTGQLPAHEWNFSDVNPPVHAWATIFLHRLEQLETGSGDMDFLKRSFIKLLSNFTWWVNRKDRQGRGVFEGGFVGLDNVGLFDRSSPFPNGGYLEQADGTAWMALFCQSMLEISAELAAEDPAFEDMAVQFVDHFLRISNALNVVGHRGMWDEEDGFYYDLLQMPDGTASRLKVRSMIGLLPLCATTVIEPWQRDRMPKVVSYFEQRIRRNPGLLGGIHFTGAQARGYGDRGIMAMLDEHRLRRVLTRLLDEDEFLAPYGIRALSRIHVQDPFTFRAGDAEYRVSYQPAESDSGVFGGNTNWRGPVWMPVNVLLIRALLHYYKYYGDAFTIECPTGSGRRMHLFDVAKELAERLTRIFLRDANGHRPVFGGAHLMQSDPHWRDLLLFYEYFHGDNGAGLGASHQTGWTGLIAALMKLFGSMSARQWLEMGNSEIIALHPAFVQAAERASSTAHGHQ